MKYKAILDSFNKELATEFNRLIDKVVRLEEENDKLVRENEDLYDRIAKYEEEAKCVNM